MILSKPSGKAGHGTFPMRVVGSLTTNNLVRTNHTGFYHISTYIYIIIIFHSCNLRAVMNLDGCVRLFSLQLFRTLPVGDIH